MHKLLNHISEALAAGKSAVLITIIERRGSAPRGVGSAMAVFSGGGAAGTIGGGAVEYAAAEEGRALLSSEACQIRSYRLQNAEAGDLGMVCGGEIKVLLHPLHPGTAAAELMQRAAQRLSEGEACTLVRRVVGERLAGAELLDIVFSRFALEVDGEGIIELIEPIGGNGRVYLFGGGHVSAALCPALAAVDFRVTVLEDREEFATKERFPTAEKLVTGAFSALAGSLELGPRDGVVVMTRGHQSDYEVLSGVLKTGAGYIGCIGSRKKVADTKKRLLADGFCEADIVRVHAPIGLAIGAETPAEIAVSIAAEMIQYRAEHG